MYTGLIISIGLHAAVIAALWLGPPKFGEPMAPSQPMSVEVVPAEALERKSAPTKPDEAPAPEPEPAPKAKPAPESEPTSEPAETARDGPEPAAKPPEPESSPSPPAPDTARAPAPDPEPDRQSVPKPRSKPNVQQAPADAPEPEPEPEPEAEPAPEPEPTTKQAKPEDAPDPPKPAAKPTPRVQLEDKQENPKDESEDQLTSILKDVESELSKAAEKQDTKTEQPDEPRADQQARAAPEAERTPTASQQLSASQIGNVRRQLQDCWSVPAGAKDAANLVVEIAVTLNRDGSVRRARIATTDRMNDSFYRAAAESALRAVHICSPLEGLPVDKYDTWRNMRLTFDPEEMFGS